MVSTAAGSDAAIGSLQLEPVFVYYEFDYYVCIVADVLCSDRVVIVCFLIVSNGVCRSPLHNDCIRRHAVYGGVVMSHLCSSTIGVY